MVMSRETQIASDMELVPALFDSSSRSFKHVRELKSGTTRDPRIHDIVEDEVLTILTKLPIG